MNKVKTHKLVAMTLALAIMALATMLQPPTASAKDVLLNTTIQDVVVKPDKNGNEYVRFIINEERMISGVKYTIGVPVMCFGDLVETAKSFQKGADLKLIASSREYQGRTSYTAIAFVQ